MSSPGNPTPQFSTAEFQGGPERCQLCGQTIGSTYYRVGPSQACPACAEKAKFEAPKDTHSAYVRGAIFGVGGAVLGLIAYSTFAIITGIVIGYLSLLVGYLVAKAIMMGSKGIGGRRYQVTAVALTYAAVSMSAIPIGISMLVKEQAAKKAHLVQHPATDQSQSAAPQPPAQAAPGDSSDTAVKASSEKTAPEMNLGAAIGALVFAGLASPFLELEDPVQGAIGLIILLVGIRIAWKMTAGKSTEILGPFNHSTASPPSQG
jgi:predicted lipid-binding transport protein (Tim44 family)